MKTSKRARLSHSALRIASATARRLARLLDKWLREHEAKRVPFTVEATEKKLDEVSVGGLKLRLRADRIDALENGQRLLLDYKTGEV